MARRTTQSAQSGARKTRTPDSRTSAKTAKPAPRRQQAAAPQPPERQQEPADRPAADTTAERPEAQKHGEVTAQREERYGLTAEPPEFHRAYHFQPPEEQHGIMAIDAASKAMLARMTAGVTPFGLTSKFFTWWLHAASSP
ncbi:MAG: poly-beta-hydroxybutyrate polymerase N-terminal domain-containing protein, partial [Rhodosalinus sp.]